MHIYAGKKFVMDTNISRRKFLGSAFLILQYSGDISGIKKIRIIQHGCLPILIHGVDVLRLNKQTVHKLSMAHNTAIFRCFDLSGFTSVRQFYFLLDHCLST